MKSSHHLFDLIQSLTSSEKSYFKKNSTIDGSKEKSYIKLFDIINDMKVYDENVLTSKLKKSGIEKSISNLKDYLYELILENLVAYHKNAEDELMLFQKYLNNKVLLKKGLFEQAKEYSKELSKLADEKQNNIVLLLSYDPYVISCCLQGNISDLEEFIAQFETLFTEEIKQINNIYYHHLLFMKNALHLKKLNYTQDNSEANSIKSEYNSILKNISEMKYSSIQSAYYNELGVYSYLTKDPINEYIYKKKAFDIYFNQPEDIKKNTDGFAIACYNFSWKNMMFRLFDQYEFIITQIDELKKSLHKNLSTVAIYHLDITYYGIILTYYNQSKQLVDKKEIIDEVKKWVDTVSHPTYYFKNRMNEYIIECYFNTSQYDKAIDFINKWLHDGDKNKVRSKVSAWAYLLMIHFEEGNYELVNSLIFPAIKYFRNCNLSNASILYFIKVFKKINNDVSLLNDKVFLKKLIDEYPDEDNLYKKIGAFNFQIWLKSRLNKVPYYEEFCKTQQGYNYELLDKLIDLKVPLYETDFLKEYKKTGIQIK